MGTGCLDQGPCTHAAASPLWSLVGASAEQPPRAHPREGPGKGTAAWKPGTIWQDAVSPGPQLLHLHLRTFKSEIFQHERACVGMTHQGILLKSRL